MFDYSKLKVFADDNFKFDERGRKFSKRVENTVGNGEIARYDRFLLFPQWFQKTCTAGLVWERVKYSQVFTSRCYSQLFCFLSCTDCYLFKKFKTKLIR